MPGWCAWDLIRMNLNSSVFTWSVMGSLPRIGAKPSWVQVCESIRRCACSLLRELRHAWKRRLDTSMTSISGRSHEHSGDVLPWARNSPGRKTGYRVVLAPKQQDESAVFWWV